jgi:hypothetical protein
LSKNSAVAATMADDDEDAAAINQEKEEYDAYVKRCEAEDEMVRPQRSAGVKAEQEEEEDEDEVEQLMKDMFPNGLNDDDDNGGEEGPKKGKGGAGRKPKKPKAVGKKKAAAATKKAAADAAAAEAANNEEQQAEAEVPLEPLPELADPTNTGNLETDMVETQRWATSYATYIERILLKPEFVRQARRDKFSAQCAQALRQAAATVLRLQRRYEEVHRVLISYAWQAHHVNTHGARRGVTAMDPFSKY